MKQREWLKAVIQRAREIKRQTGISQDEAFRQARREINQKGRASSPVTA